MTDQLSLLSKEQDQAITVVPARPGSEEVHAAFHERIAKEFHALGLGMTLEEIKSDVESAIDDFNTTFENAKALHDLEWEISDEMLEIISNASDLEDRNHLWAEWARKFDIRPELERGDRAKFADSGGFTHGHIERIIPATAQYVIRADSEDGGPRFAYIVEYEKTYAVENKEEEAPKS